MIISSLLYLKLQKNTKSDDTTNTPNITTNTINKKDDDIIIGNSGKEYKLDGLIIKGKEEIVKALEDVGINKIKDLITINTHKYYYINIIFGCSR